MFSPKLKKAQLASKHARHYRHACLGARKAVADTRTTGGAEFDIPGESEAKEFSDLLRMGGVPMHQYYLEHNRFPKDFIADYYRQCNRNAIRQDNPASDPHGQAPDDNPSGTDDDAAPTPNHARSVGCRRSPRSKKNDELSVVTRRRVRRPPARLLETGPPSRPGRPSCQSQELHASTRKAPNPPTGNNKKRPHKHARKKTSYTQDLVKSINVHYETLKAPRASKTTSKKSRKQNSKSPVLESSSKEETPVIDTALSKKKRKVAPSESRADANETDFVDGHFISSRKEPGNTTCTGKTGNGTSSDSDSVSDSNYDSNDESVVRLLVFLPMFGLPLS